VGATPVLTDCADDGTFLIDTDAVAAAVTARTRAIIPVHLYGQAAMVEQLMPLAERAGAWVVEDAAQSQGARRHGSSAGALGHAAATSFYPGKNLGAYGDAGAALTGSDELATRLRLIGAHGSRRKYEHEVIGLNSRLATRHQSRGMRRYLPGRIRLWFTTTRTRRPAHQAARPGGVRGH
jgi:dTDP-4-amino-4,6-dideoxygalactose transaminase